MKKPFWKGVSLEDRQSLKRRAVQIRYKDTDSMAELMIDIFFLYLRRPVTKSEFIPAFTKLLAHDYVDVRSPMLSLDVKIAFERCCNTLAIKYVPKQFLLPGGNYE